MTVGKHLEKIPLINTLFQFVASLIFASNREPQAVASFSERKDEEQKVGNNEQMAGGFEIPTSHRCGMDGTV